MEGFMHFITKNHICGQKLRPGGLIDPLEGQEVKRKGALKI